MRQYKRLADAEPNAIENAALAIAAESGYRAVTRDAVAERTGFSTGTVSRYMSSRGGSGALRELAINKALTTKA